MSEISKLEGISTLRQQNRKLLPAPEKSGQRRDGQPDSTAGQQPSSREATAERRLRRTPSASFLAQLSLQYDDISAARTARRERQAAAARAYVIGNSAPKARVAGGRNTNLRA
ncbi:MAG: hypothetical protein ACR2PO_09285 [Methyloligellaceae bacterium]